MIRIHEFNTKWYGKKVGIVEDATFFMLPHEEQKKALNKFAWVEFRHAMDASISMIDIKTSGFFLADIQIAFRIGLNRLPISTSAEALIVKSADEQTFSLSSSDLAPFVHERFLHLPGISSEKINQRYSLWSNQIIADSPETCLQLFSNDILQGWFLSSRKGSGIDLTLAMLHKEATVSGMLLYHAGLMAYRQLGINIGSASFSVTNTQVLNIYSKLGAQFIETEGCWLFVR